MFRPVELTRTRDSSTGTVAFTFDHLATKTQALIMKGQTGSENWRDKLLMK